MQNGNDKFDALDLERACDDLATIPYFPVESRTSVMTGLREMCPHRTALRWLTAEAKNHVNKWPGIAELRGLLCTRYDPADGIDHWCSLPGYTATDAEAKHCQLTGKSEGFEGQTGLSPAVRGDDGYVADDSQAMLRKLLEAGKGIQ
jgi:hypothetical protein